MERGTLATVPDDVLAPIIALLDAHSLGRLWFSGNIKLCRRLVSPHLVRRFDLEITNARKLKWPKLMASFPTLIELRIVSNTSQLANFEYILDADASYIPKSVERLELKFENSLHVFLQRDPTTAGVKGRPDIYLMDMNKFFPCLRTWHLSLPATALQNFKTPLAELPSLLPSTLSDLDISFLEADHRLPFAALPPGLTKLTLRLPFVGLSPKELAFPQGLDGLPSTLTSLTLYPSRRDLTLEVFKSFPTGLLELAISAPFVFVFSRDIDWSSCFVHLNLLESLSISTADLLDATFFQSLPRSLLRVAFGSATLSNPKLVSILPTTLTSMNFIENTVSPFRTINRDEDWVRALPRNLTGLDMQSVAIDAVLVPILPYSLTSLQCAGEVSAPVADALARMTNLTSLAIDTPVVDIILPFGLQSLEFTNSSLPPQLVRQLNRLTKLKTLTIFVAESVLLGQLMVPINNLSIMMTSGILNIEFSWPLFRHLSTLSLRLFRKPVSAVFYSLLPRSLTSFSLSIYAPLTALPSNGWGDLPRGLTSIDLSSLEVFGDAEFRGLPIHHLKRIILKTHSGTIDLTLDAVLSLNPFTYLELSTTPKLTDISPEQYIRVSSLPPVFVNFDRGAPSWCANWQHAYLTKNTDWTDLCKPRTLQV